PFLSPRPPHRSPLLNPIQTRTRFDKVRDLSGLEEHKDKVGDLAEMCDERRALLEQERIHFWLHSWLLLHIPLSLAVLVLGAVHPVTALLYWGADRPVGQASRLPLGPASGTLALREAPPCPPRSATRRTCRSGSSWTITGGRAGCGAGGAG